MSLLDAAAGIANAALPLPWLVVGGQPSVTQLLALHDAGICTVIDIRDQMEPRPMDEPTLTATLGMRYLNVPVVSGALTDDTMKRVLDALRTARDTPTLLHCNSGNRTGGPLIAYLMLDHSVDQSSAIDIAMRGGLRSVELLEWGTDYATKNVVR